MSIWVHLLYLDNKFRIQTETTFPKSSTFRDMSLNSNLPWKKPPKWLGGGISVIKVEPSELYKSFFYSSFQSQQTALVLLYV